MSETRVFSRPMLVQHITAFVVFALCGLFWIHVRRDPVLTYDSGLSNSEAMPGGFVSEWAIVRRLRSDCSSTIHAEVLDSQRASHRLPDLKIEHGDRPATVGSPISVVRKYTVPLTTPPGPSVLIVQREYSCWPFYRWLPIYLAPKSFHFTTLETSDDATVGPAGPAGPAGPQGIPGIQGVPGPQGPAGR